MGNLNKEVLDGMGSGSPKGKALKVKMGGDGSTKHLAKTVKRGVARFKGVSHQTD